MRTQLVLTLLGCVLAAPLDAQSPAELAGHALNGYPWFHTVRSINEDRSVECAIDVSRHGVSVGQAVDVYVTAARTPTQWSAAPALVDVRASGHQTITVVGGGISANTFTLAAPGVLSANAGAGLGVGYDVVIDVDQDGSLGAGDLIDGYSDEAGFYLCHDTTLPGPYTVQAVNWLGNGPFQIQRVHYPTNIASLGQVPVIQISHGWRHDPRDQRRRQPTLSRARLEPVPGTLLAGRRAER